MIKFYRSSYWGQNHKKNEFHLRVGVQGYRVVLYRRAAKMAVPAHSLKIYEVLPSPRCQKKQSYFSIFKLYYYYITIVDNKNLYLFYSSPVCLFTSIT